MTPQDLVAALLDGQAHSGAALAARFGVTRAAVWKRIEELRADGLDIAAAAGRGYRLAQPVELLDAARIAAELSAQQRDRLGALDVHWDIDSTSSALLRAASAGAPSLSACLAERQSAGRGRRGRAWQSPLCGNVYFSLLRRFDCGMAALSGLSLAAGVALARALADVGASGFGLKWPNDVLAGDAKLAGILVELGGEFLGPCHAVIGIGVNLRLPEAARAAIDQPATDLAALCAAPPGRNRFAGRLLRRLIDALDTFEADGFAAFRAEFAQLDLLAGNALELRDAHGVRHGVGAGVDARGALLLTDAAGTRAYESAEVTVRRA